MKLVNLCKRLIDLNAQIYWKIDKDTFIKEDYFAIFDKQYLICARKQLDFENAEALLRLKNDFFNSLCIPSFRLRLKSGEIEIQFAAASSIIYSNEDVVLNWDTKNAHEIEIEPEIGMVSASGSKRIKIKGNTQFKISAKNKDHSVKKSLFIRVIENKEIDPDLMIIDYEIPNSLNFIELSVAKIMDYFNIRSLYPDGFQKSLSLMSLDGFWTISA